MEPLASRIRPKNLDEFIGQSHPLGGDRKGQWSFNVTGDWRAVYEFMSSESVIFLELGTHPQLYK